MEQSYKQKFYDTYAKDILPILTEFEQVRLDYVRRYKKPFGFFCVLMSILAIAYLLSIGFTVKFFIGNITELWLVLLVCLAVIHIITFCIILLLLPLKEDFDAITKEYKNILKDSCIKKVLSCFGASKDDAENYAHAESFRKSGLFSNFNHILPDDQIQIMHSGITVCVDEVEIADFKGVVLTFPSNKPIKSPTMVTTKGDMSIKGYVPKLFLNIICFVIFVIIDICLLCYTDWHSFSTRFATSIMSSSAILIFIIYDTINKFKKYQKVTLEDCSFDKDFCVFSQDQIEARYLVTPAFMERMKNFQTVFGTKNIKCSFFDDKIMFAISTKKDLFEIGDIFTPTMSSEQMNEFFDQIMSIYEMIDYFKLAEKTGL